MLLLSTLGPVASPPPKHPPNRKPMQYKPHLGRVIFRTIVFLPGVFKLIFCFYYFFLNASDSNHGRGQPPCNGEFGQFDVITDIEFLFNLVMNVVNGFRAEKQQLANLFC